jgi:imidazolonepropionase-like amidohydrolase
MSHSHGDRTLITNVQIFDGRLVSDADAVLIEHGLILAVERDLRVEGAHRIDGKGGTLLPGLFDAHVHTPADITEAADGLRRALELGVTSVICMGAEPLVVAEAKRRAAACMDVADLRSAGYPATVPGGHPTQFGLGVSWPKVSTPDEADRFVAERLAEGSEFIKVILEDRVAYGASLPTLSPATLSALVSAAHSRGALIVAHVTTRVWAERAIEAGVDGLAHLVCDGPLTADLVARFADAGVFVITTLTAHSWNPNFLEAAMSAVVPLRQAGVPIVVGTDRGLPGSSIGESLHSELDLLVTAGLSPVDALTGATAAPAVCFGLNDRGRIVTGASADLLLLDGDPITDISAIHAVAGVWRGGVAAHHR